MDIKSQYYKLSKSYHPDLNRDNAAAAEKFRMITEAYEVLGNYRLRKLYDKGIIHTAGKNFSHHAAPDVKTQPYDDSTENETDDATTKFYKSRLTRKHTTGKSNIYDFDEWTAAHYGATFEQAQKNKWKSTFRRDREINNNATKGSHNGTIAIIMAVLGFAFFAEYILRKNYDAVDDSLMSNPKNDN